MYSQVNRRGYKEHFTEGHLKLSDLKERAQGLENIYLSNKYIPTYPRPELHVTHLKHDTERGGLRGIRRDEGFRNPNHLSQNPNHDSLLWWSLAVGPDDIQAAERRLLEKTFPDRTEEQAQRQHGFLGKFATSPAFQEPSRLGSYRFTFPLEEVLKAYSEQFCSGAQPVMRVYETVLYKQEVMYVVLVHSPADEGRFSDYPLLTDDPNSVCCYKDGCFIWRPEAMCNTHRYKLVCRHDVKKMDVMESSSRPQFYVWDHVALALQVDNQVLNFDPERLRQNLKFCRPAQPAIIRPDEFDDFDQAAEFVKELWPDCPSALQRAEEPAGIKHRDTI